MRIRPAIPPMAAPTIAPVLDDLLDEVDAKAVDDGEAEETKEDEGTDDEEREPPVAVALIYAIHAPQPLW